MDQDLKLMPDTRHAELIKSAETCIGLMNIGVDPDAALLKVAEDALMTDKEVELVSCAVNNSKQLAHLQDTKGADKESPFPLTNASYVMKMRDSSKDKNWSQSAKDKQDAPDALDIAKRLQESAKKEAAADSYEENQNFRGKEPENFGEMLKAALFDGVEPAELQKYVDPLPFDAVSPIKHQIEACRMKMAAAQTEAASLLTDLANELRKTAAPAFIEFEKVAVASGVDQGVIDTLASASTIDGITSGKVSERLDPKVKLASTLFVSPKLKKMADDCVRANSLIDEAATYASVCDMLIEKLAEEEGKIHQKLAKEEAGAGQGFFLPEGPVSTPMTMDITPTGDPMKMMSGTAGGDYNPVDALVGAAGKTPSENKSTTNPLLQETRQTLGNIGARASIESLMMDPYIKGHNVPEIVDAYNRAISVNPGFGKAELIAYIRQDLATKGGVPLDVLVRASRGRDKERDDK